MTIEEKFLEINYRVCVENKEKYYNLTSKNDKSHSENLFLLYLEMLKEYVKALDNGSKLENELKQLYLADAQVCIRKIEFYLDTNNWK